MKTVCGDNIWRELTKTMSKHSGMRKQCTWNACNVNAINKRSTPTPKIYHDPKITIITNTTTSAKTHFTPKTLHNKTVHKTGHLLHQAISTPDTCFTAHLLHQTPFHQTPLTPSTFYTRHFLQQTIVTPDAFYTTHLMHQTTFRNHDRVQLKEPPRFGVYTTGKSDQKI